MANSHRASRRSLQLVLVLTTVSALLLSSLVPLSRAKSERLQERTVRADGAKPKPGRPEGDFPNLNELRNRRHTPPQAAPEIPSGNRSRRKPLEPRNGRRVGNETAVPPSESVSSARLGRKAARSTKKARSHHPLAAAPTPLLDDSYMLNFFTWAVAQAPSSAEATYWMDMQRSAYANANGSLVLAIREMGKTLFESARYASLGRSDHWYVHDLYQTYLMRGPDPGGWAFWEGLVPNLGREAIRRAFDESTEFINLVNTITPNGGASSAVSSLLAARTDPFNQPDSGLKARDAAWSIPLLSLPGRSGLDLGLGLSYSSMVWTSSGPYIYFDEDNGSPSPGFRLGFPTIQERFFNAKIGDNAYLLVTGSGKRVELRQVGASNVYEAGDSSYLQLIDNGTSLLVRSTDGTQMTYGKFQDEWRCQQLKDRNGNYITVNYNTWGDLTTVTDTLGRVITFNYDSNGNLISITQPWNGSTHTWATFGWGTQYQSRFNGNNVVGPRGGTYIPAITQVSLHDGSRYNFEYTTGLQVSMFRRTTSDNVQRSYTIFDYDSSAIDCPRVTASRVQAEGWTGINYVPAEVVTQYSVPGDGSHQLTAPDGTVYKEFYGTGWQRGLVTLDEVWSGGVRQKWTTTYWTQDNTNLSYQLNPRVAEANVYDAASNRKRTQIEYHTSFGLPLCITEYAADGVNVIRFLVHHYRFDAAYLDRRIIGLPDSDWVFDNSWQVFSKTTYSYDATSGHLEGLPAAAVQHDGTNYGTSFVTGRGNLSSVRRWDTTDYENASKTTEIKYGHNITGAVTFVRDPLGHQNQLSYADAFSDSVNRNTFAYPTTITEGAAPPTESGFNSFLQYNFDLGAKTRAEGPPPHQQTQGRITTLTYDAAARVERVTTTNNGAYTRYVYGPNYVETWSSVNNIADEAHSVQFFTGTGAVLASLRNHPGSAGGNSTQLTYYDIMGRLMLQSNPTEMNNSWQPSGDDAAGWFFTQQSYDWKGRPLRTTHADGTYKEASYGGCGCAGGAVVTLTDEGTIDAGTAKRRQQKIYADVLGRTVKKEVLNWQGGSVYSATVNSYNVRDQVTLVRQYSGAEGSGTYQDTTKTYDGHARVKTRHVPSQSAGTFTSWDYYADDTVQKITDARGASQTFSYNSRDLTTNITYAVPSGSSIIVPASASFAYDAAGNRTSMTDGSGTRTHQYNQLSRLTSETKSFTGLSTAYSLNYGYNLAGQVTNLVEPSQFYGSVNYTYDTAGRITGSTASGLQMSTLASGLTYRAWGAPKHIGFGNGVQLNTTYNSKLLPTLYELTNVFYPPWSHPHTQTTMGSENQYYADGRLSYARDLQDGNFDRGYAYDHAGRLKEAYSGREARGLPPLSTPDNPFLQSFVYDVWGNMGRSGRHWTATPSDLPTYTNNRRPDWYYDESGNALLTTGNKTHGYNAAGQQAHFYEEEWTTQVEYWNFHQNKIDQIFDGDGKPAIRTETRDSEDSEGTITHDVRPTYLLRSSVLGGAIINEIDQWGSREGHVYLGGERIADYGGWAPYGWFSFRHVNPLTGSWLMVATTGDATRTELDPLGADVGLTSPYIFSYQPTYNDLIGADSLYYERGNPFDMAGGCILDGMSISCSWARELQASGAAAECPNGDCGPRARVDPATGRSFFVFFNAFADGYSGFMRAGSVYQGRGQYESPGGYPDGESEPLAYNHARDLPQDAAKKAPCTFNINLTNRSSVPLSQKDLTALGKELNAIFATAGFRATLNSSDSASTPAFNYNLTIYNSFPASYPQSARNDRNAIGYTLMTRKIPDSAYPDIAFPGPTGGVSVSHLRASYGARSITPSSLAFMVAGIGAHESIAHYLLMEPGHNYTTGITADGFNYGTASNRSISDEVKEQLEKICSSGQLPR